MADQTAARTYGRHEPVAIVGIGCRLPARIEDPTALWQALLDGVDAVRQVPADRWNATDWADAEASGGAANRRGGFLDDVTGFDAEHFSIPPAEARQMDPQQRIALEVACAAVEDARRSTASLAGTRTGVFMGAMWQEYALFTQGATEAIHAHSAIGWDNSVIPSRIAYALGLRGPVMGVATASSSSLVAVHLAVQSLRSGESDFALAGGVNLMLHPNTSVAMTKLGTQSPDGLCRAFDADGDGYARGEGCAVVVLRRLSDALADGDRVYALVHGSAVNNDGATDGLTAPGHEAQAEVLRSAWENAGVAPSSVSYVEAHGTGTPLGDVTEAGALGTVFGPDRPAPLRIGSAKTNFGHLEAAAGVLGLVKAALAVHHGVLPPSLHFRTPNPRIDFAAERLDVVTEAAAWPDGPRFAGVSSFGYGGTNAHVALGEAPEGAPVPAAPDADRPVCLAVSGTSPHALARNAERLANHLGQSPGTDLPDIAGSLVTTRTHHPTRGVVIAGTADEAVAGLRALAADESHDAVVTGEAAERGRVAFVFPGQGAQWWGMGRSLWEQNDAFREAVTACDEPSGGGWAGRCGSRTTPSARP
ncbi:type I polyketide synthase [Streptomyces cavourensis]|uniref:type I polyketide synthase n=1 Tax=Streptomyces cavourensis TaxID=67258 RepID=UPI0020C9E288|nr:type I polyketide synthase [Streptomyces cavourensis]